MVAAIKAPLKHFSNLAGEANSKVFELDGEG
jgi:hypothetical protein